MMRSRVLRVGHGEEGNTVEVAVGHMQRLLVVVVVAAVV